MPLMPLFSYAADSEIIISGDFHCIFIFDEESRHAEAPFSIAICPPIAPPTLLPPPPQPIQPADIFSPRQPFISRIAAGFRQRHAIGIIDYASLLHAISATPAFADCRCHAS
jgi:hypothetical protein